MIYHLSDDLALLVNFVKRVSEHCFVQKSARFLTKKCTHLMRVSSIQKHKQNSIFQNVQNHVFFRVFELLCEKTVYVFFIYV